MTSSPQPQQRIKIHPSDAFPEFVKLEANKLGRPWHKLPKFMNDNFHIFDARLSIYFLKKLRVNATLKSMKFPPGQHYKSAQIFSTRYGNIAFAIDRTLLLNILHDYYGLNKDGSQVILDESQPVTKTEDRLRNKLGQELTGLIINKEIFGEDLEMKNDYSTIVNQWPWCVTFVLEGYEHGSFTILFDHNHVTRMMVILRAPDAVSDNKLKNTTLSPPQIKRLFHSLPLKLNGRLTSLNLTVAQLAGIKPGDIIPVALNEPLPIFIGKEHIFDSAIAEDHNKLFFCDIHDR